jgi:hypothetical protein
MTQVSSDHVRDILRVAGLTREQEQSILALSYPRRSGTGHSDVRPLRRDKGLADQSHGRQSVRRRTRRGGDGTLREQPGLIQVAKRWRSGSGWERKRGASNPWSPSGPYP